MLQFGVPIQVDEIKSTGDVWYVDGYASTFNNRDEGGDIVIPGAFDRTLSNGRKKRFLHSHDPRMVLGLPSHQKPDKKGLAGRYKISRTQLGEETRQLLKDGALDSFSIGYIAKDYEYDEKSDARLLKEIELLEVSVVALPMNVEAVITDVKSYLATLGIDLDATTEEQEEQVQDPATLAEKAHQLSEAFTQFIGDTRAFVNSIDRPLTNTKRQELEELLGLCSGMEAVRSELATVLSTAPGTKRTDAKRVRFELDDRRRRLAHILKEN